MVVRISVMRGCSPLERFSTKSPASPIPPFDDRFHVAPIILSVSLSIFGVKSLEGASLRLLVGCESPGTKAAADSLASSPTR